MALSDQERDRAVEALVAKGSRRPCTRCGGPSFSLQGYSFRPLQPEITRQVSLAGPATPTLVTTCDNCGWMAEHSAAHLGLIPETLAG